MKAKSAANYRRLVSYALPCPGLSAEGFFASALGQTRSYWQHRGCSLVSEGQALELTAWGKQRFNHIEHAAKTLFKTAYFASAQAKPKLFGGFSFREDFLPDYRWSAFAPAHFVLPHYQFFASPEGKWLSIHSLMDEGEPEEHIPALHEALTARLEAAKQLASVPKTKDSASVHYPMPYKDWESAVNRAKSLIQQACLSKVVLARIAELTKASPFNVDESLTNLAKAYPNCYHFAFEPSPGNIFLGASPELLLKTKGNSLKSMALAGSAPRGENNPEDEQFAQALLNSSKERTEHQVVVDSILARLKAKALNCQVGASSVLKLSNIQHLLTPIEARAPKKLNALELLNTLHPTPALAGSPRKVALDLIKETERLPRGWFAAPIGYLNPDLSGEFSVAIRSAVIQENRAWLFAGAGIVKESAAENEWQETALKFRPMLRALGAKL